MARRLPQLALAAAVAYVLVLGWGMQRWSYDIWGALVVAPILAVVAVPLLRIALRGDLRVLLPYAYAGLAAKAGGAIARYWVAFDAYGGSADAGRYHDFGRELAGQIRTGQVSLWEVVPAGTGTQFLERFTATAYTLVGSSRLGGFMVFAFLGFWGAIFYLKAACVAVPGLARRRYALLVLLLPSIVFWPASIGKEAWMMLCLGLATWGGAQVLSTGRALVPVVQAALGLLGASLVRPHLAGMWLAGLTLALVAGIVTGRRGARALSRGATFAVLGVALSALVVVALFAIRYLAPNADEDAAPVTDQVTAIFQETERRSEQGGSGFQVISLDGPQDWPFAIVRTLTRPLPHEADSVTTLLPAAEMGLLMVMAVWGWRRFVNIPRLLRTTPYVVFALSLLVMWGLAYVSIGNLGILTRQRSLVLPVLVLLWCLPARAKPAPPDPVEPSTALGRVGVR